MTSGFEVVHGLLDHVMILLDIPRDAAKVHKSTPWVVAGGSLLSPCPCPCPGPGPGAACPCLSLWLLMCLLTCLDMSLRSSVDLRLMCRCLLLQVCASTSTPVQAQRRSLHVRGQVWVTCLAYLRDFCCGLACMLLGVQGYSVVETSDGAFFDGR